MARLRDFRAAGLLLTPGLLDSGFASLAGFSGSLYAARFLEPSALGVYALYFAAFQAPGLLPERVLVGELQREYPSAAACLADDLAALCVHMRDPLRLRRRPRQSPCGSARSRRCNGG